MTNKELKAAIKEELKNAGFKKGYRLNIRDSLYDTAIKITINDPTINRKEIERIVNKYEKIERDERTGEILSGCNYYVLVEYNYGIFDEVAREYEATAKGAMLEKGECIRLFDGLNLLNVGNRIEISQPSEHCRRIVNDLKELSIFIYKFAKFGTIEA